MNANANDSPHEDAFTESKSCTNCGEHKPLTEFYQRNDVVDGRKSYCKKCDAGMRKKYKSTPEYRAKAQLRMKKLRQTINADPEMLENEQEKRKRWKANYRRKKGATPRDEISRRTLIDRLVKSSWSEYKSAVKEAKLPPWSRSEISDAEAYKLRYRLDPEFNLKERLRRQQNRAKKRDGVGDLMRYALVRGGKSRRTEELFGYTISELKSHIERQFTKGMTWDAFMAGEIHIDHVRPQSSFDLTDDDQYKQCWSLPNLRPLWAKDNWAKRDAVVYLL